MADVWIDEFLFRGRDPYDKRPPAWHVILKAKGKDGFGNDTVTSRQLSMEASEKEGQPLPEILNALNRQMMAEVESLTGEVAAIQTARDDAVEAANKIAAEANALVHAQARKIKELEEAVTRAKGEKDMQAPLIQQLQIDVAALKKSVNKGANVTQ